MLSAADIAFYLQLFKGLDVADILELLLLAQSKTLRAGDVYIHAGTTSHKLAYVKSGLIRAYSIKQNGDDVTMMLRWENQFLASIDSIIYQKPSRFIYQALEDTVLMEVDYIKAQTIIDNNPKLSSFRHRFVLAMLAQAMDRIEAFVLLSPEERYLKLVTEKPDVINRVPNKYLATLLGITPVSLSRIRKRISSARKR
jgi:CRP-like cAMP-binding protein